MMKMMMEDFIKKKMLDKKVEEKRRKKERKKIVKDLCSDMKIYILCFVDCNVQFNLYNCKKFPRNYLLNSSNLPISNLTNPFFTHTINYLCVDEEMVKNISIKVDNIEFINSSLYINLKNQPNNMRIHFDPLKKPNHHTQILSCKERMTIVGPGLNCNLVECEILKLISCKKLPMLKCKKLHLIKCNSLILGNKDFRLTQKLKHIKEIIIEDQTNKKLGLFNFCNLNSLKLINCGRFDVVDNITLSNLYLINSYYMNSLTQFGYEIQVKETLMLSNINYSDIGFINLSSLYMKNKVKYLILENITKNDLGNLLELCINCMENLIQIKIYTDYIFQWNNKLRYIDLMFFN